MLFPQSDSPAGRNLRTVLVCLVAFSVGLPIALVSVAKALLFAIGLGFLIRGHFGKQTDPALQASWTVKAVLICFFGFAVSLLWTDVPLRVAALSLVKHGTLLSTVILIFLIRSETEARWGIGAFVAGQTFLLLSSWFLVAGLHPPWIVDLDSNGDPRGPYVVWSSYLDQSMIFATTAAVLFHLRRENLWPGWVGVLLSAMALANVLFFLPGRTGYAIAIAIIALSIMWMMPSRWRLVTLIAVPIVSIAALSMGPAKVQERLSRIVTEGKNYAQQTQTESSSGWRLNAWHRSIQAIAESPWIGHGVGSWITTVKRLEGNAGTKIFGSSQASNPHQEYLLWGVELGVAGSLLLPVLLLCVVRDAIGFRKSIAHATMSVASAIAVACLFNSALYDGLIGDFFVVTLGLLLALGIRTRQTKGELPPAVPLQA